MKLITKIGMVSILGSTLLLQGCLVAAVGAGVSAVKWGNAKKLEAKVKCNDSYNNYVSLMIKSNKTPISIDAYCNG